MIDDSWYRQPPGVPAHELAGGIVLRGEDGRVLVALIKEGVQEGYSLPKGHVEPGETVEQAAGREVAEETGLREAAFLGRLATRERLNFTKRAWNVTHYCVFRISSAARGRATWFPIDALPLMFWPEQQELIDTYRAQLVTMAATRAVQTQFARRAGAYAASGSHAWDDDLSLLIRRLAPRASDRVLDVATGTGFTASAFARVAGFVVGLDFTRGMLDEARALPAAGRGPVHWVEGDAEALPFPSEVFSIVVVRRAPHHFVHVDEAMREMLRVAEPGGRIGIVDQVGPDSSAGYALMETLERLRDPSHVRSLRAGEWEALVSASGAAVESSEVVERALPFAEWIDLAGVDASRARRIDAVLARAPADARAPLGDAGAQPRLFLKRRIVLVARKP